MKKILLISLLAVLSKFGFSQTPTYIGTSINRVEVRNDLRVKGLENNDVNQRLTTDAQGDVILVSGSGGSLSYPNTIKKYLNGYGSFISLNTDSVIEGATNKWFSNARTQLFADTRYSLLGHNHTLSGLSDVSLTSLSANDYIKWDGNNWVNSSVVSSGNEIITISGDVDGVGTTGIFTTIGAGVIINNKLASVNQNTFKGRITAGSGAPEDLTVNETKGILGIENVDNTSDISKPISSAAQALFDFKAPLSSPNFTGVPTAPTAPNGTNTTQIATTEFVLANAGGGSGYTLPIAGGALGGVKIGSNINVAPDGTISTTFPVSSFNGRTGAITPTTGDYTFVQIASKPTTLSGYGISDGLTQAIANGLYSQIGHVHSASDVTSGVFNTARLATGTANNTTYARGDGIWAQIQQSTIPNLVSDLAAKAPIASPTFTGTVTVPRTTNAVLQTDTIPLLTFGAGSAIAGDTTSFTTTTIYGSPYIAGTDTLVITSMKAVVQGSGTPTVTVDIIWNTSLNVVGTHLVNAGNVVNNTTTGATITAFNNNKIPPGNYVWCKTPTVTTGSKPTYLSITLIGYKIRKA